MVQVSYPGVYIQEVSSGVKTIVGVSTSIAAFFGRATRGPINRPVRCLSFADFERVFGPPLPVSDLAISVRQFYDNGGTDCYVVRLARGADAAAITIESLNGENVLDVTAKMEGLWGNGIRLEVDYNTPNPGDTFNLRVFVEEGGRVTTTENFTNLSMDIASSRYAPDFVTQSSALVDVALNTTTLGDPRTAGTFYNTQTFAGFSQSRRPLGDDLATILATLSGLFTSAPVPQRQFDISVNNSAWVTVNLRDLSTSAASYPGPTGLDTLANAIESIINTELSRLVPAPEVDVTFFQFATAAGHPLEDQRLLTITARNNGTSVRIRRAASEDMAAALMLGVDNGGVEFARFSNFRPAPTGTVVRIVDDANTGSIDRLNDISLFTQNPNSITAVTLDSGAPIALALDNTGVAAGETWMLDALPGTSPNANNDGIREKLRRIAQAINDEPTSRYRAEVHGYYLAIIAKSGTFNQTPTVVFSGNAPGPATLAGVLHTNVRQYKLGSGGSSSNANTPVDGSDGTAPQFAEYVGSQSLQTGFYALDPVDLFNLMVLPTDRELSDVQRQQLWGPASVYCQSRRAFLLMDAPDSWTVNGRADIVNNSTQVNNLRATVVKDYSAVFYPKLRVNDAGIIRSIGPSGAIAGLMARIDSSRGVWKAPAGTEADLRNVSGLEVRLTDRENGVLNKLGANCIRAFPSGFVNWGARTMDGSDDLASEYKYIPIRRLTLFIEESLYRGTQWVVFEPNDEPLWGKIRLNVGVFMNGLFRQGAFQGSTPNEAFFVKCDKDTTTQADRNLGIVNIIVGFAPLKPAEFVVITIQQIAGDLT